MPVLETKRLSDSVVIFDREQASEAGARLAGRYQSAEPFPHIILDDFVDRDALTPLLDEWPSNEGKTYFDRDQERLKYQWQPHELASPRIRSFLAELNSEPVLRFMEKMTGIEKLIADPYYAGGGLHEIRRGGHLGVHADFNIHAGMNLVRRINLLIYLNDDWDESYSGALELWDREMKACRAKAEPHMARAVVFNTDLDSFHGHPNPLACPPERQRRSIAIYYYTAPETGVANLPKRTTVFKQRPGSRDSFDWRVRMRHVARDWTPPALARVFMREEG